ncbi:MAG: hypothetical protein U0894_11635 [Pirellulales bacterium]
MTTTDLLATLEKLRSSKHPELDAELVRDIITAQADYMASPNEAFRRISQAVETYLVRKENT